jgi:MFS family permease
LISFGGGISQPAMMALLTYASPPGQRGQTIGLAESIQGLGRILGPLAAGLLFEQLSPNAPMLTASLLTCLAALLCIPLWRMEFKPTPSLIRKRDEI